jgi:hypothetical protein
MKINLFNALYNSEDDILVPILQEMDNVPAVSIKPSLQIKSKYGFLCDGKINKNGIYFVYKEDELIYIGVTRHRIKGRIGRFFAAIRGIDRHDETHCAGVKYMTQYKNTSNPLVSRIDFKSKSIVPEEFGGPVVKIEKFDTLAMNLVDFDNITIKSFNFDFDSLPLGMELEHIEKELIYKLRPKLNIQVFKHRFVSSNYLRMEQK